MRVSRLALILGTMILWVVSAQAVDLTKIPRVIAKEPAYQGKPKYCLLVFGPEAKHRVWLGLSRICWPLRRFFGSDSCRLAERNAAADDGRDVGLAEFTGSQRGRRC